jgi:hypothetical protein
MGRWMGRWRSRWVREGLTFDESGEEVDVDVFGLGALEEPEEHLQRGQRWDGILGCALVVVDVFGDKGVEG